MRCEVCSDPIPVRPGRIPRFCSTRCRVANHRRTHRLPAVLTASPRWARADGKRPLTVDGRPASSTDPSTWTTYAAVRQSTAGDGLGVMLGDGLGCWDLDHCLEGEQLAPWAADLLASIPAPLWVERSVSGTGLHVFVHAPEGPGSRSPGVEFYSRSRFIRVTGDRFGV